MFRCSLGLHILLGINIFQNLAKLLNCFTFEVNVVGLNSVLLIQFHGNRVFNAAAVSLYASLICFVLLSEASQ